MKFRLTTLPVKYYMHFSYKPFLTAIMLLGLSVISTASHAQKTAEVDFVPHKALYDIRLVETKSGSQVVNITGQMFYEWQPSCDAWISKHSFNLLYEYADSPALQITSDFTTYETFDGKSLDFNSQRKNDGEVFEELRGNATIFDNGAGEAIYTKPRGLEFDLPEGTLFPMGHTLQVLQKIKEGKKFYNATIFDGSDEDGPIEVNAFIGDFANAMALIEPSANLDATLLNTPARNVRLAFFPLNEQSSTADYEMSLVFHDNGVVSDMFVEYGDFSLKQDLIALERVEPSCEQDPSYNE